MSQANYLTPLEQARLDDLQRDIHRLKLEIAEKRAEAKLLWHRQRSRRRYAEVERRSGQGWSAPPRP